MARIRFRAWDTDEKRWFPKNHREEWINISRTGEVIYGYEDGDPEDGDGRFVIMLSSGLKDKNGKEIYEGDILRPAEGVDNCKTGSNFVVRWNDKKAHFECIRGQIAILTDNWHLREVIGNIYDTPELLRS